MKIAKADHWAIAEAVLTVASLLLVIVAATCCYYVFTYPKGGSLSRPSTVTSTSSTESTTSSHSIPTTTTASTTSSSTSLQQPSSTSTIATSSSSRASSSASAFVVPPGGSEIVIPPGIQDVNASQLNITFQPNDLVVQVGVNNTIYFVNTDLKFNFGFDIESIAWPTGGQTFAFTILPGRICNVTLTTPGVYRYDCEMHPIWTIGTITVVPAVS